MRSKMTDLVNGSIHCRMKGIDDDDDDDDDDDVFWLSSKSSSHRIAKLDCSLELYSGRRADTTWTHPVYVHDLAVNGSEQTGQSSHPLKGNCC